MIIEVIPSLHCTSNGDMIHSRDLLLLLPWSPRAGLVQQDRKDEMGELMSEKLQGGGKELKQASAPRRADSSPDLSFLLPFVPFLYQHMFENGYTIGCSW
jgi:hypothetical protein